MISIVVAAYNEQDNLAELHKQVQTAMSKPKKDYELILIDDGSTDGTYQKMLDIKGRDPHVKLIKFRKNFGQSAAWDAGFKHAKGDVIITMDADLQNDPADIPKLVEKLDSGYDVVSGWRKDRKDSFLKVSFSKISLLFRKAIIDDKVSDSGCSLKAYRKEALQDLDLAGEMHRYITELLSLRGFKIGEVIVNHRPRTRGKTKYNMIRLMKGFLDLLVVAFWQKYSARPVHLFGGLGILSFFSGAIVGLELLYEKFMHGAAIANRPLLLLAAILCILGLQMFVFGLMSDILIKLYYNSGKKSYYIESVK
ncbi:MAG: glycosyltransferase family 2 protein [Nanoarchaeota archaeon]|nr:glycosyltransferase family 2 protein [Nanoarchaeota archaeon]